MSTRIQDLAADAITLGNVPLINPSVFSFSGNTRYTTPNGTDSAGGFPQDMFDTGLVWIPPDQSGGDGLVTLNWVQTWREISAGAAPWNRTGGFRSARRSIVAHYVGRSSPTATETVTIQFYDAYADAEQGTAAAFEGDISNLDIDVDGGWTVLFLGSQSLSATAAAVQTYLYLRWNGGVLELRIRVQTRGKDGTPCIVTVDGELKQGLVVDFQSI